MIQLSNFFANVRKRLLKVNIKLTLNLHCIHKRLVINSIRQIKNAYLIKNKRFIYKKNVL